MPSLVRLGPAEVDGAHQILVECGRDLAARFSLRHWDPPYPIDRFRDDARARELYAVRDEAETIGTFTVGATPLAPYPAGTWSSPGAPALYLNRLAILPSHQRRGIGEWCLARVAERARALGAATLRCDAIAAHALLLAFYLRLGFHDRGHCDNQGWDVVCLEKLL